MPFTPVATRLQRRMEERRAYFETWLFKWFSLKEGKRVTIELFNGKDAHWEGIGYSGTVQDIFWEAIARGIRNEIIDQYVWVEEEAKRYDDEVMCRAIDECAGQLVSFAEQVRKRAIDYDRRLRGDGRTIPAALDRGFWFGADRKGIAAQAEALKKANCSAARDGVAETGTKRMAHAREFQVALSFAGEQREYVEAVANELEREGVVVFYDRNQSVELWGRDGAEYFTSLFANGAAYVVMFISRDYIEKAWPRQERRAAISKAMNTDSEYILPVRFDRTEVPGMADTMQYLEAASYTPKELATAIITKIGHVPLSGKASDALPPHTPSLKGEVSFDYDAYNGVFVIGDGDARFETKWSSASDKAVHVYNDPASIHGIAIAVGAEGFNDISDATTYDFSSRSRKPHVGEVVVFQNKNAKFAAAKILSVANNRRGAERSELKFAYMILPDGSSDFSSITY